MASAAHSISATELAEHVWGLAGRHGLSLDTALRAAWPLDAHDQPRVLDGCEAPLVITADQWPELLAALLVFAFADGAATVDVLRAFADGLDHEGSLPALRAAQTCGWLRGAGA